MIFVIVGTQLPFDRLIKAVDRWASLRGRQDLFAQIGPSQWKPPHLEWAAFIDAAEFRRRVEAADAIVAHAGMGSIITALELGKPILVMPRRAELGEHRNDHQVSTAKRLLAQGSINVAFDEDELLEKLDLLGSLRGLTPIGSQAPPQLIVTVQAFIRGEDVVSPIRSDHIRQSDGERREAKRVRG